jgi:uncharacterized HAD superfamily protein
LNYIKEDLYRLGEKYFERYGAEFNPKGYYLKEIWRGAPEEAYSDFWNKYGYEIYTNPPRNDAVDLIKYMKKNGMEACYITTRDLNKSFSGTGFRDITEKWLVQYGIELPVYYRKDKDIAAKELGVTLMVEDKPANILKLQKVTRVLIFDHPYNEDMEGEHMKSWKEIFKLIAG